MTRKWLALALSTLAIAAVGAGWSWNESAQSAPPAQAAAPNLGPNSTTSCKRFGWSSTPFGTTGYGIPIRKFAVPPGEWKIEAPARVRWTNATGGGLSIYWDDPTASKVYSDNLLVQRGYGAMSDTPTMNILVVDTLEGAEVSLVMDIGPTPIGGVVDGDAVMCPA